MAKKTAPGVLKLSPMVKASLELLGVDAQAGPDEIKKAYYKTALLYHPDRNQSPTAASEFAKVTEAFELLKDPHRVAELNRRHLKEKLHRQVIEGIEITFGSFFGYRLFDLPRSNSTELRITGEVEKPGNNRKEDVSWNYTEASQSILDHPAYDGLEVVYAGKFSVQDEHRLKGQVEETQHAQLPWVVLNNQGILRYLEGDLKGAKLCYQELCVRVPNNLIFMYRLGLCLILEGFKNPKRTFFGKIKPDMIRVEKGIEILKHCIRLAEARPVGRQRCLVIRKTLADVYEKIGQGRKSRAVWRAIYEEDPKGVEANYKVRGRTEAIAALKAKAQRAAAAHGDAGRLVLLNPSGPARKK